MKIRLRLLRGRSNGLLEWKPELTSLEALASRVGGSAAVSLEKLSESWTASQDLSNRTRFSFLAPSGNSSQIVSRHDLTRFPVFAFDILLRPPVAFADEGVRDPENVLTLGRESLALIVHGTFEKGALIADGMYCVRVVIGADLVIPNVVSLIPGVATECEFAMYGPLRRGDFSEAVERALPAVNVFAKTIAYEFLA